MTSLRNFIWLIGACICLAGCGSGSGGGSGSSTNTGGSISGRAVNDTGSPVSGAQVALMTTGSQPQQTVATTTTGANGSFSLSNLTSGNYVISVSDTPSSGTTQTGLVTVSVSKGSVVNVTVDLSTTVNPNNQTGSVVGMVTLPNGTGVSNVTVTLSPQSNLSLPTVTTTTDTAGHFSLTSVAVGSYLVSVKGAHIGTPTPQSTVVQASAASQVDFTVYLTPSG